ncbi:MAG: hypothetical protein NTW62_03585 [Candidatus Nomurabacteria bacterium]|nr:hypothetical protein [Candidatus Nomurabacteria bacterium]
MIQKKVILNSPKVEELKKKRRKELRNKIIFWAIIVLAFFVILIFLSRIKKINIDTVVISGNKIVETKDIENIVKMDLSGNYMYFLPHSNRFIYPEKKIKDDLMDKFKRIIDISINLKGNKILEVNVKERDGKYLYCGETAVSIDATTGCYFIDDNGYIFDNAPYFSDGVYFKFYGHLDDTDNNPVGLYFLKNDFMRLVSLKENLEKLNLKINSFFLNPDGYMIINLSSGAEIRFKTDSDFDKLVENLHAALTTETFHTDFQKKYDSLLYIDLRFGNKIYYKFK